MNKHTEPWFDPRAVYIYSWGNNSRRAELKGRRCVIEATGSLQTALIRFLDNEERVTTSRRALRRLYGEIAPAISQEHP